MFFIVLNSNNAFLKIERLGKLTKRINAIMLALGLTRK